MFKKVITHKNFWRSVLFMGIPFMIIMFLINWGMSGFEMEYFDKPIRRILSFAVGAFIYGFTVAYIKFWTKLKEEEQRGR